MLILIVTDPAVEEREQDRAILHGLHIFILRIHRHRPEDDLEVGIHVQDFFVRVEDRDLTAATGGCPVHGEFGLVVCCHAGTSST